MKIVTDDMILGIQQLCDDIYYPLIAAEGYSEYDNKVDITMCKFGIMTYRLIFTRVETGEDILRIKYFAPYDSLIIEYVMLENRHRGTFTQILDTIKEWSKNVRIKRIVIESVLSLEMNNCALKNGFTPVLSQGQFAEVGSFFDDTIPKQEIFLGNFEYEVK